MSLATVEAAGVALTVDDRGAGPPVLLIHGPCASRTSWDELVEALGTDARTLAYDRRGHGASEASEPFRGTTVGEQAEDAAAVLGALDAAPALVCGHDLGALVCLDLLLRHRARFTGAVLIEPPLLSLSPAGSEAVGELREALERGAREDGGRGAVDAYLEHVAGPDACEHLGPARTEEARAGARALAIDLAAAPAWRYSTRELRALDAPVAVIAGGRSQPVRREVAERLAQVLGRGGPVEADAGHLCHIEDPGIVASIIRELA